MISKSLTWLVIASFSPLISCDSNDSSNSASLSELQIANEGSIDAELQIYLNTFLLEARLRGVMIDSDRLARLTLKFEQLPSRVLGTCIVSAERPTVAVNEKLRGTNAEWTTIHELGHCLLRMEHRDDVISIMNTFDNQAVLDLEDRKMLFDEFFQEKFFNQF